MIPVEFWSFLFMWCKTGQQFVHKKMQNECILCTFIKKILEKNSSKKMRLKNI